MTLQQYDFVDINCLFRKQLELLLPENDGSARRGAITEKDIKHISLTLQKFTKVPIKRNDIANFLDSIVKYFWVILKYSRQFNSSECYKHYLDVRMALDVFLFVIDSTKLYSDIASKFVKIIDKIVVDFNRDPCVKEFLRMYAVFLSKVVKTLGTKHKSLRLMYELAKSTCDIEVQAVILEVVLRLFDFNVGRVMQYNIFPEIADLPNMQGNNLYEATRMILDALNKNSSKIFSINCTKITLDKKTIIEFDGANSARDIWLDINIPQKVLSFFCSKKLITLFTHTKFNSFTSWGVLSFRAEDALKTDFIYDSTSKSLEITITIKSSDLNLFGDFRFDIVRQLVITIPKHSDNFSKLVTSILPNVFTEFCGIQPLELNISQVSDDLTPDNLSVGVGSNSSSPVISALRMIRKKLSTICEQDESEDDVINLLTDDEEKDEEIAGSNNKVYKEADRSQQTISGLSDSNENLQRSFFSEHLSFEISKRRKTSTQDPEKESLFQKSFTTISFTDSMVGKAKRDKRKVSVPIEREDNEDRSKVLPHKIDRNKRKASKISTYCQTVKFLNEADETKMVPEVEPIKIVSHEDNTECSSRVEDWLKTVSPHNAVEDQENIPPNTTPQGQTPSVIEDLDGVEKWIEKHKETPVVVENQRIGPSLSQKLTGKTESLLELLAKDISNVETQKTGTTLAPVGNKDQSTSLDKITPDSDSSGSHVPLSKLVKKWNAGKKAVEDTLQPPTDVITVTEEVLPPPKEILEITVAEEKIEKSANSTHVSEDSIFMDVAREKQECVDLESHFPEPVVADVTVVEFGSLSSDSHSALDEIQPKKTAHISKTHEKKAEEKIPVPETDENHNISGTKRKRPLYNPGDYSYLSDTIADDYISSQTASETANHVVKRPRGRPKKSEGKKSEGKKSEGKKSEGKKSEKPPKGKGRRSKRTKVHKSTSCCPPKESVEPLHTSLTLNKAFDSLKKKIKEDKKKGKLQKKIAQASKGKKNRAFMVLSSPSSPSSLEPFGKLENKRRKTSEGDKVLNNSKSKKQGKVVETKVKVISNILVQPAAVLNEPSPVESPTENAEEYKGCLCKACVQLLRYSFRELLKHMQQCDLLDVSTKKMVRESASRLGKL